MQHWHKWEEEEKKQQQQRAPMTMGILLRNRTARRRALRCASAGAGAESLAPLHRRRRTHHSSLGLTCACGQWRRIA